MTFDSQDTQLELQFPLHHSDTEVGRVEEGHKAQHFQGPAGKPASAPVLSATTRHTKSTGTSERLHFRGQTARLHPSDERRVPQRAIKTKTNRRSTPRSHFSQSFGRRPRSTTFWEARPAGSRLRSGGRGLGRAASASSRNLRQTLAPAPPAARQRLRPCRARPAWP